MPKINEKNQLGKSGIGVILAVLVIVVIGIVYFATQKQTIPPAPVEEEELTVEDVRMAEEMLTEMSATEPSMDASRIDVSEELREQAPGRMYNWEGGLFDVSDSSASGNAMATFDGTTYHLYATFEDLPDPSTYGEGFFYEGWIVRRAPLHVLSTGVVDVDENGLGSNIYAAGNDWTDHDFYVLTIEPDDGDPAPAVHILEGILEKR